MDGDHLTMAGAITGDLTPTTATGDIHTTVVDTMEMDTTVETITAIDAKHLEEVTLLIMLQDRMELE